MCDCQKYKVIKAENGILIEDELNNFDLSQLDWLEDRMYNDFIKHSTKAEALQIIINSVEGDYSQLSPKLAEIAEKQDCEEEFKNGGGVGDNGYTLNQHIIFKTSGEDGYISGDIGGDNMDLINIEKIGENEYSAIAKSYNIRFEDIEGQELEDEIFNTLDDEFSRNDLIEVWLDSVTIKYSNGGGIGFIGKPEHYRYLTIQKVKNGLLIILNEEGVEELNDIISDNITSNNPKSDTDIWLELFEDVQGNSEYIFHSDMGESGFGMTSAEGITDGYYYEGEDRSNLYKTDYPESAKVYWFPNYMVERSISTLINKGEVFFTEAESMSNGGGIGNQNALMVLNDNKQIKHHTEEINKVVNTNTEVPAWVVSKVHRSASDLSDATHYLDGANSEFKNGGSVGENIKIKDWYIKEYSSDDLGQELNNDSTFKDLLNAILNGYDVYSVLGVSDSIVRERAFSKLSKINGKGEQWAYNNWLMYSNGGGVGKTHKYKLGDKYRSDFDYDGMLEMGLKANTSWGYNKLVKLHNSFEDVNYHSASKPLWDAVQNLKNGNNELAEQNIIEFHKKVKEETMFNPDMNDNEMENGGTIDSNRRFSEGDFNKMMDDNGFKATWSGYVWEIYPEGGGKVLGKFNPKKNTLFIAGKKDLSNLLVKYLHENSYVSSEEYVKLKNGGSIFGNMFGTGRSKSALAKDRKYFNASEKHEVNYATTFKRKKKTYDTFDNGGDVDLIEERKSVNKPKKLYGNVDSGMIVTGKKYKYLHEPNTYITLLKRDNDSLTFTDDNGDWINISNLEIPNSVYDFKATHNIPMPESLSITEVESKIGRKINSWKDNSIQIGKALYEKVYLKPEYKKIFDI
jgi:hypothetical protein